MKIICDLSGIVNYNQPAQGVRNIKNSGFETVFIDLKDIYMSSRKDKEINLFDACKTVAIKCKENNIQIYGFRIPCLQEDSIEIDLYQLQLQLAEEAIRICNETDSRYLIIPPVYSTQPTANQWELNREYYIKLGKKAQESNVMILLENQYRTYNGRSIRGLCSDEKEAAEWIDKLNKLIGHEIFGFSMNTGNCNLCGKNMQEFALTLGNRIKTVILQDNYGHSEGSLLPFTAVKERACQTDWLSLIRGLREIGFDGGMILDIEDTVAAFSPILKPQLLSLAKNIAEYFCWQIKIEEQLKKYKSIVLFGAGNMCRNYMKCYGEKYPPKFTCDNNPKLWGTNFCGLEVKAPEELKSIPSDWGIFICNIYYREIEKQLRDLGVKNSIEFFNDEYLPSYYFNRLERM